MTPVDYAVIALYGLKIDQRRMNALYHRLLTWSEGLGLRPNFASRKAQGQPGKLGPFDAEPGGGEVSPQIQSISLIHASASSVVPLNDFDLLAIFSREEEMAVLAARASKVSLGRDGILGFVHSLGEEVTEAYGIGYKRPHLLGPAMYALGVSQGLSNEDYQESLAISFWIDAQSARVWDEGLLRDVYPINLLIPPQLRKVVEGQPLESWIQSGRDRGAIASRAGGQVLWEVPETDISSIRKTLWRAGIVFDWTRHIEGASRHPSADAARQWAASR